MEVVKTEKEAKDAGEEVAEAVEEEAVAVEAEVAEEAKSASTIQEEAAMSKTGTTLPENTPT